MSTTKAFLHITIMFLSLERTQGYITRTPCRNSANFTILKTDKFVKDDGNARIIIHTNLNRSRCALLCVATPSCFFINHKRDDTICRLVTSRDVKTIEKDGWDVIQTENRWHQRGPLCRYLDVKASHAGDYCIDTCEPPGWTFMRAKNIASRLKVVVKRYERSFTTSKLTDKVAQTIVTIPNEKDAAVISIPLKEIVPICRISILQATKQVLKYDIIIGETVESGDYCGKDINQSDPVKHFACQDSAIFGKDVHIRVHQFKNDGTLSKDPKIKEIKIYEC